MQTILTNRPRYSRTLPPPAPPLHSRAGASGKDVEALAKETTEAGGGKIPKKASSAMVGTVRSAAAIHLSGNRIALPAVLRECPPLCKLIEQCWAEDAAERPPFDTISEELSQIMVEASITSSMTSSQQRGHRKRKVKK